MADLAGKTRNNCAVSEAIVACFLVVAIKITFFILDPQPQFFLGDSGSYINTALKGGAPNDRSFVYGYLIRYLTQYGHSLTPLVFTQILASMGVAMLVYYTARRFFGVTTPLAIAAACWCALDPMQLFYERSVMTEAYSTLILAICLVLAFDYAATPRLFKVMLLALCCTSLISLRMTYLPATLVIGLLPSLYLLLSQTFKRRENAEENSISSKTHWRWNKTLFYRYLVHFAVAVICLCAFHMAYKLINGRVLYREPAYLHTDGLFMIAGLAPLITPADAPDPRFANVIENIDQANLRNWTARDWNRFCPGGLVAKLNEAVPDARECNDLAKKTAINTMLRAPLTVACFGISVYLDYFNNSKLNKCILSGQGAEADLPESALEWLRNYYTLAVPADWGKQPTATKQYQMSLKYWNYVLVLGPIISIIVFFAARRRNPAALLIIMLSSAAMMPGLCLFSVPVLRYFHCFGFVIPILFAVVLDQAWVFWRKRRKRAV